MRVIDIVLQGFRNYAEASVEFDPGINVISGKNAQGKTNLLEAVFLLSGGRGFRTRLDRELIGFERDLSRVCARVFAAEREQKISVTLRRGQKKQVLVNGARKTGEELSETVRAVLFCPDDLNLIREGAAARRRLMDMAIGQLRPGYAAMAGDYRRVYENKTRLLRDYRDDTRMLSTLEVFSDSLARLSAKIIRYRAAYARRLREEAAPIHAAFSGAGETLCVEYKTVSTVTDTSASEQVIYEEILEHQRAHAEAEKAAGACLTGAHKDDLEITINGHSARSFASQGQTRTAALSLKLAEREIFLRETGEYPILLLDDVLSELDGSRQDFVLNRIGSGQTLITCCEDEEIVKKTGGKVIFVEAGKIR